MSTRSQVSALLNELNEANARVSALQKEYNDLDALAREYNRQSVVHAQNGNYNDSQIAANRRDSTTVAVKAKEGDLNAAKALAAEKLAAYNTAVATLSPEEQAAAKEEKKQAEQETLANKAKFMQGTTKYLIFGGIALVIVIAGIIYFRKKYNF